MSLERANAHHQQRPDGAHAGEEIRETGRNMMSVKLMDLRGSEKLQAIAPVVSQTEEEAQIAEAPAEKV